MQKKKKWADDKRRAVKNPPASTGDSDLIPESGRSPGERNGNPSSILAWESPWT